MYHTMKRIDTVIKQLAFELIEKDEFSPDIKATLISMLDAKENYSQVLKKTKTRN